MKNKDESAISMGSLFSDNNDGGGIFSSIDSEKVFSSNTQPISSAGSSRYLVEDKSAKPKHVKTGPREREGSMAGVLSRVTGPQGIFGFSGDGEQSSEHGNQRTRRTGVHACRKDPPKDSTATASSKSSGSLFLTNSTKSNESIDPSEKRLEKRESKGFTASQLSKLHMMGGADVTAKLNALASASTDRPFGIVSHTNVLRMQWDWLVMIGLAYIFVMTPLEVTYEQLTTENQGGWFTWTGNTIDMLFWIDILISFRTTYDTKEGEEVFDVGKITMYYFKDFFFIDLFCCLVGFPVSTLISQYFGDSTGGAAAAKLSKAPRILRVMRTIKMVKIFRLFKIAKFLDNIQETFSDMAVFVKLMKLLFITSFFLHINACCFSLVAQSQAHGESWVDQYDFNYPGGWTDEYVTALYWSTSTSTTVGYGDIIPGSNSERLFSIISMALGVGIYGYIIGSMTEVVTSRSYVDHRVQQRMDEVHAFIKRRKFPRQLGRRLRTFFRTHFSTQELVDEQSIMLMLPSRLLNEVREVVMDEGLCDIPFFSLLDNNFFPQALRLLSRHTYHTGEDVINANENPMPEFFILRVGAICMYKPRFPDDGTDGSESHVQRMDKYMKIVQAFYAEFDTDDSGGMNKEEVAKMLECITGKVLSKQTMTKVFKGLDADGSGTVDVNEFVEWYVFQKIENDDNVVMGPVVAVLQPWREFATWTAFNLGKGDGTPYTYRAREATDVFAVSAEKMLEAFGNDDSLLDLIEKTLVSPAREYGVDVDCISKRIKDKFVETQLFYDDGTEKQTHLEAANGEQKHRKDLKSITTMRRTSCIQRDMFAALSPDDEKFQARKPMLKGRRTFIFPGSSKVAPERTPTVTQSRSMYLPKAIPIGDSSIGSPSGLTRHTLAAGDSMVGAERAQRLGLLSSPVTSVHSTDLQVVKGPPSIKQKDVTGAEKKGLERALRRLTHKISELQDLGKQNATSIEEIKEMLMRRIEI